MFHHAQMLRIFPSVILVNLWESWFQR